MPGGCRGETCGRSIVLAGQRRSRPAAAARAMPNPSSVSTGGSSGVARRWSATPAERSTSRRSMSTNRPDSGRLDQSAFAGDAEQHDPPGPARRRRHQRRAVGERRPGPRGQAAPTAPPAPAASPAPRPGPAARRTATSAGTAPARPAGSRTAPRPSCRSPASSRTGSSGSSCAGSCSPPPCAARRSGSAARHSRPSASSAAALLAVERHVGQDQHRERRGEQFADVALAQLAYGASARRSVDRASR